MRRRLLAVLAPFLLVVAPASARADGDPSGPRAAPSLPRSVDLAVVGEASNVSVVEDRTQSWFRGRGIATRATRLASVDASSVLGPSDHEGVRVWIVLEQQGLARLFFAVQEQPGRTPRYLVVDVPLDNGLDELGVEQVAGVVYLSSLAIWAGTLESPRKALEQELGRQSGPPPASSAILPPAAPPPPSPSSPLPAQRSETARDARATAVRLGAEYSARLAGDEGIAQTLGLSVSLMEEGATSEMGGRLRAGIVVPRQITKSGVQVDLQGLDFGLSFAAARKVAERTWVPAEVGLGLELVRYRTGTLSDPSLQPTPGGLDARPVAQLRCGVRVELGALRLGLDARLDVELRRSQYEVSEGGQRSAILVPWSVQPGLAAGVSW